VLVKLRGQTGIFVRDITDINHPVNRCKVSGGQYFRFVSATKLSYLAYGTGDLGSPASLYVIDLTTGATSLVLTLASTGALSSTYAWSPDGSELSYITSTANDSVAWHLLSAAGDKVLLGLGNIPARGGSPDNDDAFIGFSADGKYVAIEQTLTAGKGTTGATPPIQVDRVADGTVAYSRTDGTMAAWAGSGARLYFRSAAGVQSWDAAAGVLTVSAGTNWIHPHASPDGSRMAFSVLNAQGNHVAAVLDITSSSGAWQQLSPQPRAGAAFIDASLVWYAGESICTTASPCGLGGPPLSGSTYIYDLGSGVEAGSLDTAFYDAWPHVAGQS
jgi:dipeptidyl aminopeptidase/acylaminoacyl peptidase